MRSRLAPDSATTVGILTAMGVYLIYSDALPNGTDVRAAAPHDDDVDRARKHAAWISAGLVATVFLVARDINSYVISGAALVGIDYFYKHNNAVHPATGRLDAGNRLSAVPGEAGAYPLPDYDDSTDASYG